MASRRERGLRAYRIADRRHPLLDGSGALLFGARWNSPGRRVVYASLTFAGAMLEVLAHTGIGRVPRTLAWIEITVPPGVSVEEADAEAIPGWDGPGFAASRAFGDRWYDQRRSAVLLVPSVVTRVERNALLHQEHPGFPRIRASEPRAVRWDERLFGPG